MQNTTNLFDSTQQDFEFDLKGSLHGRRTPHNILNKNIKEERKKTLKEWNYLEIYDQNKKYI